MDVIGELLREAPAGFVECFFECLTERSYDLEAVMGGIFPVEEGAFYILGTILQAIHAKMLNIFSNRAYGFNIHENLFVQNGLESSMCCFCEKIILCHCFWISQHLLDFHDQIQISPFRTRSSSIFKSAATKA